MTHFVNHGMYTMLCKSSETYRLFSAQIENTSENQHHPAAQARAGPSRQVDRAGVWGMGDAFWIAFLSLGGVIKVFRMKKRWVVGG